MIQVHFAVNVVDNEDKMIEIMATIGSLVERALKETPFPTELDRVEVLRDPL